VQRPEPQRLVAAAAVAAGDVGQSLNPESLMKLELAWASDVTAPPQIADERSSMGPERGGRKACHARQDVAGRDRDAQWSSGFVNDIDGTVRVRRGRDG